MVADGGDKKNDDAIMDEDDDDEIPVDKEEVFLKNFPGMVSKYRGN